MHGEGPIRPRRRPGSRQSGVGPGPRERGISVFYSNPADAGIDADALQTLADVYGERATKLPPCTWLMPGAG